MTLAFAALRYRNVCVADGGPIAVLESDRVDLQGTDAWQANATLREELAPARGARLFSPVDGSGTHRTAVIARHIAVSEAIERWALLAILRQRRGALYGFDIDPTSNGMAAFPGLFALQARRFAWLEAVERYCLFAWWERRLSGKFFESRWAGVSGVEIHGPFPRSRVRVVILFSRTAGGRYAYGHAAGRNLGESCRRALIELSRHRMALDTWDEKMNAQAVAWHSLSRMERRSLYFSTKEGFAEFWGRVENNPGGAGGSSANAEPETVFDREIPGPWSRYAHVWRVVFEPVSQQFLEEGDRFFFW